VLEKCWRSAGEVVCLPGENWGTALENLSVKGREQNPSLCQELEAATGLLWVTCLWAAGVLEKLVWLTVRQCGQGTPVVNWEKYTQGHPAGGLGWDDWSPYEPVLSICCRAGELHPRAMLSTGTWQKFSIGSGA
jgi:hypothetical protein